MDTSVCFQYDDASNWESESESCMSTSLNPLRAQVVTVNLHYLHIRPLLSQWFNNRIESTHQRSHSKHVVARQPPSNFQNLCVCKNQLSVPGVQRTPNFFRPPMGGCHLITLLNQRWLGKFATYSANFEYGFGKS